MYRKQIINQIKKHKQDWNFTLDSKYIYNKKLDAIIKLHYDLVDFNSIKDCYQEFIFFRFINKFKTYKINELIYDLKKNPKNYMMVNNYVINKRTKYRIYYNQYNVICTNITKPEILNMSLFQRYKAHKIITKHIINKKLINQKIDKGV